MANSDPDLKWLIITASCQRVAESKSKRLLDVEESFSSGRYGWQVIAQRARGKRRERKKERQRDEERWLGGGGGGDEGVCDLNRE